VLPSKAGDVLCIVTANSRALVCKADEAPELANPGRGVTMIKVADDDGVLGFGLGGRKDKDVIIAETESGKTIPVGPGRYEITSRGGKGHALAKRSKMVRVSAPEPPATDNAPKLLN